MHKLPPPLPDVLLDDGFVRTDDFAELKAACSVTFAAMSITSEEAVAIELETRGQSSTNSWFRYRAGRITASNFRAAIRTQTANPDNLARSLIKRICYPGSYKFTSAATDWGCSHESVAVSAYRTIAMDSHSDFSLIPSPGLQINPRFPHLGASPDALVECSCHGMGIMEVKCPYCKRTSSVDDAADDPHSTSTNVLMVLSASSRRTNTITRCKRNCSSPAEHTVTLLSSRGLAICWCNNTTLYYVLFSALTNCHYHVLIQMVTTDYFSYIAKPLNNYAVVLVL